MGLLEDAIREHIELKRRHGADPGDVARLEREALGPVQRGAEAAVAEPAGPESEPESVAPEPVPVPVAPEPVVPEPVAPFPAPRAPERDPFDDIALEPTPDSDSVVTHGDPLGQEAGVIPEAPVAHHQPEPVADPQATEALPVTELPDSPAADAPAEDVLEETPDFLEETPEHERLWFEQKPPRDFDFDG